MKMIDEIKSVLICVTALLMLSSCAQTKNDLSASDAQTSAVVAETSEKKESLTASTAGTDTVTVNGVVYRNKFQGDLILRDPKYGTELFFSDSNGRYYQLEGTEYDLIYNVTSAEIGAPESVYCRDDQWQELKAYYSDTRNFTYQYITNQKGGEFKTHTVDEMDISKLNELIDFCEKNSYNPFSFFESSNTRRVSTASLGDTEYRFGMNSNDGFFSLGAARFYILENRLVLEYYAVGSQNKTLIVDVPQELSDYFISLINV